MCALHPLLEKVESYRSRKGESVTDVEESDHHIVRMGERDDSGEESEWETDEEGEGDPQENENEENEAVVEEGCPVKPGDLLVSARPFVYAIQGQFKNKVCDWCFV